LLGAPFAPLAGGGACSFQLLGIEHAVFVRVELVEHHRRRVDELILADFAVAIGVDAAAQGSGCTLAAFVRALARVGVVDEAVAVAIHSRKERGARVVVFLLGDFAVVIGIGLFERVALTALGPALRSSTRAEQQQSQLS
jgi:hypothetical protein